MKKIAYALIVIGLILVVNSLIHSIVDLWSKQDLVKQAQLKLDQEKKENEMLKSRLKIVQSKPFIESEARNKLFMVKPGESQVILPGPSQSAQNTQGSQDDSPNWQKWVSLFFPS